MPQQVSNKKTTQSEAYIKMCVKEACHAVCKKSSCAPEELGSVLERCIHKPQSEFEPALIAVKEKCDLTCGGEKRYTVAIITAAVVACKPTHLESCRVLCRADYLFSIYHDGSTRGVCASSQ